ncbi:hypothetical protein B0H19DRAFT_1208990 [Mycena capillaripes]|nr:hypothetical protein B0H19DRAFT_1208990 [Mycena capillaripes]
MSTYSAWFAVQKGHPREALELKTGLPIPTELPSGHVLVKVQAVALNPAGYKLMGAVPNLLARRPHVAENDVAGIIVDPNGSEFSAGAKVFGSSARLGTLAEYVSLPSSSLALAPPNGLVEKLKVEPGQTVFINGGSSAIGLSAIQIAKSMGCRVVATASGRNKDVLLGLGVDEFIDYTQAPLVEQLIASPPSPKFHGIFDAIGLTDPALYLSSASYLAPGGTYLTAGTMPHTLVEFGGILRQLFEGFLRPTWLGGVPRKYAPFVVNLGKKDLETVGDLVARDGVMRAYERMMSKRAVGKP